MMNNKNTTFDSYCINYKKKNVRNIIIRVVILILIWLPLVIYYISPLSRASSLNIYGNALNFNEEYIYEYTSLNDRTHLWNVDLKDLENKLNKHPYCNNANVTLSFKGINIDINEVKVVAKDNNSDPTFYLSNGISKTYSNIKDLLNDPLSDESKFIKPYIDNIPLINKEEFKNDEFYEVCNVVGTLDYNFLKNVKEIRKNNDHKFLMVTFVMDKNKIKTNEDVLINIDYRDIDTLLNTKIIETIVTKLNNGDNKYNNVLIENDIVNNSIKVVPYN